VTNDHATKSGGLPIVWMVSDNKARGGDLLKPPADSFFGRVIDLPVLVDEQAETLLRRRAGDELDTATLPRVLEAELGTTSTVAHERW
jgi:hypothetical protein